MIKKFVTDHREIIMLVMYFFRTIGSIITAIGTIVALHHLK